MDRKSQILNNSVGGGTQRLYSFDKLKAVCAFLIVLIHSPFPGEYGEYITALTRIAVPIFLMISGFFYNPKTINQQIKKMVMLVVEANFFYFVWQTMLQLINGNLVDYYRDVFTIKNIMRFLFLNETHFGYHLWYLGAALYAMIAIDFFEKKGLGRRIVILIPILLICDLIFGKYSLVVFGKEFDIVYVRNWIFVGIPFYYCGILIRKYYPFIQGLPKRNVNKTVWLVLLFTVTTIIERYILIYNNMNGTRDQYFSTTFLAISVMFFAITCVRNNKNIFAIIGEKYSLGIYIIHPIILAILGVLVKKLSLGSVFMVVKPILIYVLSAIVIWLLSNAKNRIKTLYPTHKYINN